MSFNSESEFSFDFESENNQCDESVPTPESPSVESPSQSMSDKSLQSTSSAQSAESDSSDEETSTSTFSVTLDNEQVEIAFNDLVMRDAAHSLIDAKAKVEELETEISLDEQIVKQMNENIEAIRKAAQEQINRIAQDRNRKEVEMREQRQAIREAKRKVETEELKFRQTLENQRKRVEFEQASDEFDKATAGAPWREFALPHQIEGAKKLALVERGILGDKMGLGKTLTSLIWLDMLKAKRIAIIVPADVLRNFEREIAHWTPHRSVMTLGKISKAERQFALKMLNMMDEFIITINYEAWRKDKSLLDDIVALRLDAVILDEAHTIKNTSTAAFKGMKKMVLSVNCCPRCSGSTHREQVNAYTYFEACDKCTWNSRDDQDYEISERRSVKYVLPMTGTPILNKPQDLFPLLHLILPERFVEERDFLNAYCTQDYYTQKWTFRHGGVESLTKQLGSRIVARDRHAAGVVLPPQTVQIHDIDFDKENYAQQWRVIRDLSKHGQIILDSGKALTVLYMIALITRQRQANVWPGGIQMKDQNGDVVFAVSDEITESLKMDKAQGMIEEFVEGQERIVLFSQFKTPLRELAKRLQVNGIRVAVFDGDTSESERDAIKIDFDRKYCDQPGYENKWDVVLCNYKTGGVGLNFTSATQMIILDEEWNPGKRDQGYGRIDRIGQTQETTVHVLRIADTIDTWMANLIEQKEDMIQGFEQNVDLQQQLSEMFRQQED